ncbi:MAG: hypothetical protein LAP61_15190 [Acidobacteriia bacterium]|nr:hypothetical protein [Terriglobia bacterium]
MKLRSGIRWLAFAAGVAAGGYAAYVGATWLRYGRSQPAKPQEADELLDGFMPEYEISERHHVNVDAPADITFSTACAMDLQDSGIIRAIFKTRELLLRGKAQEHTLPRGLLAQTEALGWTVLAEIPGCEIVMGSVTQPWKGSPEFKSVAPDEFAAFHEPGYVKIAWTLRADSIGPTRSVFRTETRVVCTDAAARAKFRRYWSFLSPGIILIRRLSLGPLKKVAEYRARKRRLEQKAALVL